MIIKSDDEMKKLGQKMAGLIRGGDVLELVGDVGAGKTTFTKGLARGLGVTENVSSPTFVVSSEYEGTKLRLVHYDFYRLNEAGIMSDEIFETMNNPENVTVIEWGGITSDVLPSQRIILHFNYLPTDENLRQVVIDEENKERFKNVFID